MRPDILFPLFRDIGSLPGVGPAVKLKLEKLGIKTVRDCYWHVPFATIDRRSMPALASVKDHMIITADVTIYEHKAAPYGIRRPYQVACGNDSGDIILTFFHAKADYIQRLLPVGERRIVSGRAEWYNGVLQMAHPDHIVPPLQKEQVMKLEAVYPLTAGISLKQMRGYVEEALKLLPALPEWGDAAFVEQQGWPAWHEAIERLHHPEQPIAENDNSLIAPSIAGEQPPHDASAGACALDAPAPPQGGSNSSIVYKRLAYDELLANQLALAIVRRRQQAHQGIALPAEGDLRRQLLQHLPFRLTQGQQEICAEIAQDIHAGNRMLRLLQGDVGSGKTVVALWAMLAAVEAGKQTALMAPTEIVARQHVAWIAEQLQPLGLEVGLLVGSDTQAQRSRTLQRLASGELSLVVGTHALFQDKVAFRDLAMVVIDEQHRFGVSQRLQLAEKGRQGKAAPHMLLMTATPIPRTLAMTAFGDMDVSRLTEKPPGRKPVDTRVMPLSKLPEVVEGLPRAMDRGARIYWICPLVEESDESEGPSLAAVEQRFTEFNTRFPGKVGMVHGRIKAEERQQTLLAFQRGEFNILIATTVVEVGVNVPEATIMVIEHAERFGLAQLHQLRGRVGRGDDASSCLLLYQDMRGEDGLGETGKRRLKIMRDTEDGFLIAEEDLRIRGSGEVLGTKQSGLPAFHFANLAEDQELALAARDDVRLTLQRDPELKAARGEALRTLLYLHEYDRMIKYLGSG